MSEEQQFLKTKKRLTGLLPLVSLLIVILVFWWLKLTGITLAGEAFCGISEHVHSDECSADADVCDIPEHIHTASCYSDIHADIETADIWEGTLLHVSPSLASNEKIAAVARSQLGYTESTLNFEVDENEVRRGYTRYGEWYGNPYGDWSSMFTAFCLRYAGLEDIPVNSGAEVMRLEWDKEGIFKTQTDSAFVGDILFMDKNQNGTADATAIITGISDSVLTVIEGDIDNKVAETSYRLDDPTLMGIGTVPSKSNITLTSDIGASASKLTANTLAAAAVKRSVWFDGTNGGLMGLGGSPNKCYSVNSGESIQLPSEWQPPDKYQYKLAGWFDVKNKKLYKPGAEISVTEDLVFYADWVALSYDVGQYNTLVTDTVSTADFIETHVFDYNSLFNVMSEKVTVTVSSSSHSESWSHVASGTVPYNNSPSLNFIFTDYDGSGDISYPSNRNSANTNGSVYSGIYNDNLADVLFDTDNSYDYETGKGIIGKTHVGTADHLFSLDTDPDSENYGYYYYDSKLNAASYNQTDKRFYVYDYLERTADSEKDGGGGAYSDFLPFNSPYALTNGKTVKTYSYAGENGEYGGVTHYQYDAKYNTNNNSVSNVGTNYAFGMSIDLNFYLIDTPGTRNSNGEYGNQDIHGKDMHFKFSGDDDVWVLLDGKLVLDIGGVHGIESGDINFSTGEVTINGSRVSTLSGIEEGSHKLTVYYLERGSSQSNCAIYFNLAPRFYLNLQKEDVLSQHLLNGAEFTVYTDKTCSVPAKLWVNQQSYKNGDPSTNVFKVTDGCASMWGLCVGRTYYIKETSPPDSADYSVAHGIISLAVEKYGFSSYNVEILDEVDAEGNVIDPVSKGFTIHGVHIDEQTRNAYLIITNAEKWVNETTSVSIFKKWSDTADHSNDSVTVYLTVTDGNGTRRIREAQLNTGNDWTYTWTNLPKYHDDGVTEIAYGVTEEFVQGYTGVVENIDKLIIETNEWITHTNFETGKEYILETSGGYLSTTNATSTAFTLVNEQTAKSSSLALWTATLSNGTVTLKNKSGQKISFNNSGASRYYYPTTQNTSYQALTPTVQSNGITLHYVRNSRKYYLGSVGTNGRATATTSLNSALLFKPKTLVTKKTEQQLYGIGYSITNELLTEATSLKVTKVWDKGMAPDTDYEQQQVVINLFADGEDTNRKLTLDLKNGWTATFEGLPYKNQDGEVINYTVTETAMDNWMPVYSEIKTVNSGKTPTYEATVTNVYGTGYGYELPATGGYGPLPMILCGMLIMAVSLICGYLCRRKRERGQK